MLTRKYFSHVRVILSVLFVLAGGLAGQEGNSWGVPPAVARAQETLSNISGAVVDTDGAAVPGVHVLVINDNTRLQREASANGSGLFVVPLLPAGTYTLTAEMQGFATVTVTDIQLRVSINSTVNIVLQPRGVAETVNVVAEANQIDATSSTLKYSVTSKEVGGLPVLTSVTGRNALTLLPFLVPGVIPTDVFGTARISNGNGGAMSINGARSTSNSFNLEGADNNDAQFNESATTFPNPDALREFTVLTNSYEADQGRSAGGVINAVIKSGTDKLHGNLRYYIVNDAFNARGFFDQERPTNKLHAFGGQLGGPVRLPKLYHGSGRTFFFFDYEGTRSHRGRTVDYILPTEKQRRGDFSDLPVSQRPRDPRTGQPFPGGIIPPSRLNPISLTYLERFVPLPNSGENLFLIERPTDFFLNQYAARVDHKISGVDNLSATVYYDSTRNNGLVSRILPVTSSGRNPITTWNVVVNETHTFSPRVVNQFTAAFVHRADVRLTTSPGVTQIAPSELGFTGIHPQTQKYLAVPAVSVVGTNLRIDPRTGFENFETFTRTWQFRDDLSYTRGNHAYKFGADVRSYHIDEFRGNSNGSFRFSSTTARATGNAIANFLLGLPNSFTQDTGSSIFARQMAYYFYAMDDWRVRPNLTLNLGLRYELSPPLRDKLGQVSVFRPGQKSLSFPQAPEGLLFLGDPDPVLGFVPPAGYFTDRNNFAPRIGIAYSPKPSSGWPRKIFGDGKTAIRAGWGVYYDATLGTTFTDLEFTEPFAVSQSLTARQISSAGGTFANPFGSRPNPFPLDLGTRTFTFAPNISPTDPTFRTAYTYQYNLTIQRELPWSLLMEVSYVGSNSFKLNRQRDLNLAVVTADATPDNFQERRLFPELGDVISQESTGRARYDAAQLRLSRRFSSGLIFDASYVFSKTLDNGSFAGFDFSPGQDRWARAAFDRRHNFVLSYTYDLPTIHRKGLLGRLFNGWQIGGITQMRSGAPLAILQELDPTLTTSNRLGGIPDFVGPFVRLNPRQFQTIIVNGVPVSGNFFFDPNAFRVVDTSDPSKARPGNLGRNVFDGPGLHLWDVTIIRKIKLAEGHRIDFRADIRNLFNRPLFELPETLLTSGDPESSRFGMVTSSGVGVGGRTMQFSLRYSF